MSMDKSDPLLQFATVKLDLFITFLTIIVFKECFLIFLTCFRCCFYFTKNFMICLIWFIFCFFFKYFIYLVIDCYQTYGGPLTALVSRLRELRNLIDDKLYLHFAIVS